MKKQITAALSLAVLAVLAACGAAPTAGDAAPAAEWQASQQDTTGRVPNLFGSGN